MPSKKVATVASAAERVQNALPKLKSGSEKLNQASDRLNESASKFNAALKPLGLGITSWYEFDGATDRDNGYSWSQLIGYAKISGKWGLAIKRSSHDWSDPEPDVESWPFADAPRALRVKAAPHIPDLLEQMIEDVAQTIEEVSKHSTNIDALAAVLEQGTQSAS